MSSRCFGDKRFLKSILKISLPIMIQSGITSLVSMVDNLMIGAVGTEAMSGVSIVNQLLFIFSMVIFGVGAACGIFTSQYHGANDAEGVRYTFRVKLYLSAAVTLVACSALTLFGSEAIGLFLHSDGEINDLSATLSYGEDYLAVMLVGLAPYALSQVYASTLRETGEVRLPMYASILAIVFNCALNGVLIFGLFGFPALGVVGAAIATVIARFAELIFLVVAVHGQRMRFAYITGVYRSLAVPKCLLKGILLRGSPLIFNELIWSLAMTFRTQCLSVYGLDAVAAVNIQSTLYNLLNITYSALGSAIAIILGNMLGAGRLSEAKEDSRKLLTFAAITGALMGVIQIALSPLFPLLYNTASSVRELAGYMLAVSGVLMAGNALAMATYYTLRSGGLALLTMLFDCVYAWAVTATTAFLFAYVIDAGIHVTFAAVTIAEASKCLLGLILVSRVKWARRIT